LNDRATAQRYVNDVKRLRAWFATELQRLGVKTFCSGGNFLLANFGPGGPALFQKLEKQGILLRDRSKDIGPGFVRITIGTQPEMRLLLKSIRKEWKAPA
jgi:histidinol-phosphate/aromatic aminotransferase/cobyric acid decarboxylase-like protein